MRIVDLLRPYEEGLERIADETPATIEIRRHIFMSDKVAYERSAPGSTGPVPRGTIVITVLGPDRQQHGDPAAASAVIARLETGARAIVLFGWEPSDLPYHRILDALTEHRCQVLQVAALDLGTIGSAAVIERVDELVSPRNALGELVITAPGHDTDQLARQLRMANEYVFGEFDRRNLRTTLGDASKGVDQRRFNAYRAEADLQLKERDKRIRELQVKLEKVETSTSLKLGRT
ncbi:MAG: hypothetical protein M3P42_09590, partial [Actinomycetota bacterium]|nr:hypothetical protein [Actinomycetota bacterium]